MNRTPFHITPQRRTGRIGPLRPNCQRSPCTYYCQQILSSMKMIFEFSFNSIVEISNEVEKKRDSISVIKRNFTVHVIND